jgi:hypothetical protein
MSGAVDPIRPFVSPSVKTAFKMGLVGAPVNETLKHVMGHVMGHVSCVSLFVDRTTIPLQRLGSR